MVTKLPIFAGEKVKLVLLVGNTWDTTDCHPTLQYAPVPIFLSGEYDDYGRVENIDDPFADTVVETINNSIIDPLDKKPYSLMDLQSVRDRIYIQNFTGKASRLRYAMIKEQVYCDILDNVVLDLFVGRMKYEQLVQEGYDWVEYIQQQRNSLETGTELSELRLRSYVTMGIGPADNPLCRILDVTRTDWALISLKNLIAESAFDGKTDQANRAVQAAAQMSVFDSFMRRGRNVYAVPSGGGSQDESTEMQRLVANLTLKESERINAMWEDMWDDEDDYDDIDT
jgi:hypothetical protein